MKHEDAAPRIADLEKGRLPSAEAGEVEAHRRSCAECRELSAAYRLMAEAAAPAEPASGPHLSTAEIAAMALGPRAAAGGAAGAAGAADAAARHLSACGECAADLRDAQEANRVDGLPAAARRGGPGRLVAIAAALVCAVLGLAAFTTWRRAATLTARLGALETERAGLEARVTELSRTIVAGEAAADAARAAGMVAYLVLSPPGRGAAGPDRLALRPGQAEAYLALAIDRPRQPGAGPARVTVLGPDGATVLAMEVPASDLQPLFERGEALLLRIPAASLHPGTHAVLIDFLTPDGKPGTSLRLPFAVVPAAP